MLILERKGFWFWGDRLTIPVFIIVLWTIYVRWFLQVHESINSLQFTDLLLFILLSLLSLILASLAFKKIRHVSSLNVKEKTLEINFTNNSTQIIPIKDITSVGLNYKTDHFVKQRVGYYIGYRKEEKNLAIPMAKGYSVNGKNITDHEALALLGKELDFKKTETAWGGWMTWTKS